MALASNDNPYWVNSRVEILYTLNELRKMRSTLSCEAGRTGEAFTTEILAVDADSGMLIDVPPLPAQLDAAMRAGSLSLCATMKGIRIEFELEGVGVTQWEGASALRAPLPGRVLKIQRRNFFRIAVPKSRPLTCVITAPGSDAFSYPILDIGLGGVALSSKQGEPPLEEGRIYEKCRIVLPEMNPLEPRIVVRHAAVISVTNRPPAHRYGCEFIDLKGPQESLIQRFVLQLERDRRAADLVDS